MQINKKNNISPLSEEEKHKISNVFKLMIAFIFSEFFLFIFLAFYQLSHLRFTKMDSFLVSASHGKYARLCATHPHRVRRVVEGSKKKNNLPTRNYEYFKNVMVRKHPM